MLGNDDVVFEVFPQISLFKLSPGCVVHLICGGVLRILLSSAILAIKLRYDGGGQFSIFTSPTTVVV